MAKTHDFAKQWFATQGWKPFAFQKEVWAAVKAGQSGLLHASTGAGKTYALWFAALNRFAITRPPVTGKRKPPAEPLTVLWITPMRALATDSARALQAPLEALQIPWSVGLRTGDTS
ncbi:DEAD/DEAH box helicase, partial [Pseudomonas carnis]